VATCSVAGSPTADPRPALAAAAGVTTVALLLVLPATATAVGAITLVAVWQLSACSFVPAVQAALYRAAGPGGELALSFAVFAFNVGIVLGAGLGGIALDSAGLPAVAAVGGGLSVAALVPVHVPIRQNGQHGLIQLNPFLRDSCHNWL
jgi:DHA1 family inner membrane transport protein